MVRLGISVGIAALLVVSFGGDGQAVADTPAISGPPAPAAAISPDDQASIKQVEVYLENLRTARARFTQTTSEGGLARGQLHLARPGKLLLDYDPPAVIRIIATGGWIRVVDTELESVTPIPVSQTPLSVLLTEPVQLSKDVRVRRVARSEFGLRVTVVRTGEEDAGELTLYMRLNPMRLTGWRVLDGQGVTTEVLLQGLERNIAIAPKTFIIDENFGVD